MRLLTRCARIVLVAVAAVLALVSVSVSRAAAAITITEYPLPVRQWFSDVDRRRGRMARCGLRSDRANYIGRITTAGVRDRCRSARRIRPTEITLGPDGALWFTLFLTPTRSVGSRPPGS